MVTTNGLPIVADTVSVHFHFQHTLTDGGDRYGPSVVLGQCPPSTGHSYDPLQAKLFSSAPHDLTHG